MAAPATAERTRAAAGAMPVNLKEAAPFWLKFEGVVVGAEEVPLVAGVDEADVRGVVVNAGVDKVDMLNDSQHNMFMCRRRSLTWSRNQ